MVASLKLEFGDHPSLLFRMVFHASFCPQRHSFLCKILKEGNSPSTPTNNSFQQKLVKVAKKKEEKIKKRIGKMKETKKIKKGRLRNQMKEPKRSKRKIKESDEQNGIRFTFWMQSKTQERRTQGVPVARATRYLMVLCSELDKRIVAGNWRLFRLMNFLEMQECVYKTLSMIFPP